uniref:G_PROTEIN_RECEP_F1_2 domain-containing protein n=1 Tax=Panagrellus redivivus TaxID=6233 RepID=A0A7E4VL55_PANRE
MEIVTKVLNVELTPIIVPYCEIACIVSIVVNLFFLVVTHLRRVEGFQEVLIFMRNISIGYILMSLCLLALVPRSVTLATSTIRIPYGILQNFDATFLNGIASFGAGIYLYTAITFCILFLYRYNVTCKTTTLSTIFSRANIFVFLVATAVVCLVQAGLIYYSAVDATFLRDRLNRTRDLRPDLIPDIIMTQVQLATGNQQSSQQSSVQKFQNQHSPDEPEIHGAAGVSGQSTYMQTTQKTISIFGLDYQRNPLVLLSFSTYGVLIVISFLGTLVVSLVVMCKLNKEENYGREQMSNKSKDEQRTLTKILMLAAYTPMVLIALPAANFVVSIIRGQSYPLQEVVTITLIPLIPITFPLFVVLMVPALRVTAWQVCTCQAWTTNDNSGNSDINGNTVQNANKGNNVDVNDEATLSDAQMKTLKSMAKKNQTNPH